MRPIGFRFAIFVTSLFTFGLLPAGCALNRAGTREVRAVIAEQFEQRSSVAADYASVPAVNPTTQPTSAPAIRPLCSLRDYILRAMDENPDIKAARERALAKAKRIPQVTALPDPMLNTRTWIEPVRTAEGDNYFNLGISQKLPVPEKLDRAGRIALEETRMAIAEWEQTRQKVIGDVKRAYFQLYIIDQTVRLLRDNQDLVRSLIDVTRSQLASGRRGQQDVLRAQVERSTLESRLIDLRQSRVKNAAMLNTLMDRPVDTPIPSPDPFDVRQTDLKLETLLARAVQANPELKRFTHEIERNRQSVKLAKLVWWPDFTLGFDWMRMSPRAAFRPPPDPKTGRRPQVSRLSEDGTDNWGISFGFNLPMWYEKNQAGIAQANRLLDASIYQYQSIRNTIDFRIEDALTRVRAKEELALLFKNTIIPQARQTYEVSRAGYVSGVSDFQYAIDNWRNWLTFEVQYYRSLGELEQSVADLEQAIGASLQEMKDAHE
jgi:outer membrane protein TolC